MTSDEPLGRIRATVRAGRDAMRATILSWLPADMRGARVLDAGCGTGALAFDLAKRGASVVAVDISPTLIDLARERAPHNRGVGQATFAVGDMLDPALGAFDYVVAMDSLIHYEGAGHRARRFGASGPHAIDDRLHGRPAHACADADACGRAAFPPRRPCAGDRADLQIDPRTLFRESPGTRKAGASRARIASTAASTSRRRWRPGEHEPRHRRNRARFPCGSGRRCCRSPMRRRRNCRCRGCCGFRCFR